MKATRKAYCSNSFFQSYMKILYHQQHFCDTIFEVLVMTPNGSRFKVYPLQMGRSYHYTKIPFEGNDNHGCNTFGLKIMNTLYIHCYDLRIQNKGNAMSDSKHVVNTSDNCRFVHRRRTRTPLMKFILCPAINHSGIAAPQ